MALITIYIYFIFVVRSVQIHLSVKLPTTASTVLAITDNFVLLTMVNYSLQFEILKIISA